jgi:tetratricopeptide (TPR) repeat protein
VDGDILNLLAQAYMDAGQAQKAIDVLQEAIRRDPRDERNYVAAGRLAIDEDLAPVGLELLDQGLKALPKSYSILMERAYIRLSLAQYADSEADYRSAIALEPNSGSGRIGLAFVLLQSQHLPEAASLLQDVVRTHPSNYFAHYLLGEMRIHEGLDDEAITNLEKATALQPAFSAAHTNLGKLYLKKNNRAAALRELETAVKLDPEDTTAYYQLSIAYRRSGEKEKAQQALALVRRLNEEQRNLGTTRFLTQKYRKARSEALAP